MNVLLVSQCSKRALTETRRILDQFAERRGDRTWQTAITRAGLDTLRRLLRQTARKNTAVACHWIRGRDHSELLWIVGDARQFNAEGAVPTNMTASDVLRRDDENDWHSLRTIRRLAALAALLHDLGKATQSFQDRLRPGSPRQRNRYRHEWISVRLFQAFVGQDDDAAWLRRLIEGGEDGVDGARFEAPWLDHKKGRLLRDGVDPAARDNKPFAALGRGLPPLAQAVAWLVLTHHRLPALPYSPTESLEATTLWHGRSPRGVKSQSLDAILGQIDADWNEPWGELQLSKSKLNPYWKFPDGLPVRTAQWRKRAARIAADLLRDLPTVGDCLEDPFVMHVSRLALMLGDHHYSGLEAKEDRTKGEEGFPLYANTRRETGELLQPLDEHLLGVELHAGRIVHSLPILTRDLRHLIGHRGLKKRSANSTFRWQDRAADLAAGVRLRAAEQGAFIVNMASTGCGKTLGNARIMNALADPVLGLRCAFAIGLRTLTLQTGRSFQKDLGLSDDELAIRVGGAASRELFEYYAQLAEDSGSASRQSLLDETTHIVYEGDDRHPVLDHLGHDAGVRRFLAAPLLVCTVDHLTPATEGLRGGRQIVPMLRLMTGDLVLDEPDDFDLSDLPALSRLVHWAGLLGSRVLVSSATLPPSLVQGLFAAYLEGRRWFQRNRGVRPSKAPAVCCLWIDEFAQTHADCPDAERFDQAHQMFAEKRAERLGEQAVRRLAGLLPLPAGTLRTLSAADRRAAFAGILRDAALRLHAQHGAEDPRSGKRVSFGLIRMANINPLFDAALALFRLGAPSGVHIHLCVYHSQFPLFLRSRIENQLDMALDRRREGAVFDLPGVRRRIDAVEARDQLFVVLGSPVTEVGRDHDYDWAVVEPSSMRSLIQLAGRVWRHRRDKVASLPNVLVCDSNLRHFEQPGQPAFCLPGFESLECPLRPHSLMALLAPWLDESHCMPIDARLRIVARTESDRQPAGNLVDLEHVRMVSQMLPPEPAQRLNAASFWLRDHARLTAFLQQAQPFRDQPRPDVEVVWTLDDDEALLLCRVEEGERKFQELHVPIGASQCWPVPDAEVRGEGISRWSVDEDWKSGMESQAEELGLPLDVFALRYARAMLPANQEGWRWHPTLGFSVKA